jgi:hypothetical protein
VTVELTLVEFVTRVIGGCITSPEVEEAAIEAAAESAIDAVRFWDESHLPVPLSPDCQVGKHGACSGDSWDDAADSPARCPCTCHTG